jgi:hypothetical protein
LRELTKNENTNPVAPLWMETAQATLDDMKNTIISDFCLQRFDYQKLVVICTDFSALGFGYVLLQPATRTHQLRHCRIIGTVKDSSS